MHYPHPIRLRGPWQMTVVADGADGRNEVAQADRSPAEPPVVGGRTVPRVQVPGDWGSVLGPDFRGTARYTRRFHAPSGMDAYERLWLVCEGASASGTVSLDGTGLGTIDGYALQSAFDITDVVAPTSTLTVDVDDREGRAIPRLPVGGLVSEVRLEVRQLAWIDDLSLLCVGDSPRLLTIRGVMDGAGELPSIALRVVVEEREVLFEPLRKRGAFDHHCEIPTTKQDSRRGPDAGPDSVVVRVELINHQSTIWQTERSVWPLPHVIWNAADGTLRIDGENRRIRRSASPLDEFVERSTAANSENSDVIWSEYVRSHDEYGALDAARVCVVQFVDKAWLPRVAPRLAHHRSIVAWCVDESCDTTAVPPVAGDSVSRRPLLRGRDGMA